MRTGPWGWAVAENRSTVRVARRGMDVQDLASKTVAAMRCQGLQRSHRTRQRRGQGRGLQDQVEHGRGGFLAGVDKGGIAITPQRAG